MLLLDTSILIDLEHANKKTINQLQHLRANHPATCVITVVNRAEFIYGIQGRSEENILKALAFINIFETVQTTNRTADILARLKYSYDRKGINLPFSDMLIAAMTVEQDLLLVTKDADFQCISEIRTKLVS